MIFNSYTFIIFFGLVLFLHYLPLSWRVKKINLLIASYLFYAAWNPPFVVLLWISTVADWFIAKGIDRTNDRLIRRFLFLCTLVVNLGLLGFFKYGGFLLESFTYVMNQFGMNLTFAKPDIILPVGISFYTFQTLSYTLDVYMGKTRSWRSFLDYTLYVTFFPQLVAGPIVRAVEFFPQVAEPRQADRNQLGWGVSLLLIGLFQKVVIADSFLAPIVERVFDSTAAPDFRAAWAGALAFTGQIFCDFSGYSTCAIGAALCLGFYLPTNFDSPYASIGFSDFWRRWHISLSTWLRDYLYIPLGGNRKGTIRTHINLLLTMLIGGLWHGASWTFVVWGGLHGMFLSIERILQGAFSQQMFWRRTFVRFLLGMGTFIAICFTWVFFRAHTFERAFTIVAAMVGVVQSSSQIYFWKSTLLILMAIIGGMLAWHWYFRETSLVTAVARMPWWGRSLGLAAILIAIILSNGEDRAFIYFQF